MASTGPSPVSEACFTSPYTSKVISAFWGSPVPAKTFNDFKLIAFTLLSVIKLSSTNAIMSSSYTCFFLSANTLNFANALLTTSHLGEFPLHEQKHFCLQLLYCIELENL